MLSLAPRVSAAQRPAQKAVPHSRIPSTRLSYLPVPGFRTELRAAQADPTELERPATLGTVHVWCVYCVPNTVHQVHSSSPSVAVADQNRTANNRCHMP